MGQAYLMRHGSGGSTQWLHLMTVASSSELPEDALPNTLAVVSNVPVKYAFVQSDTPPSGLVYENAVWVRTEDGDDIYISSVNSDLRIGILNVSQYNGQVFVPVEAYIWDGEKWRPVSIPRTYVYENGVTNEALVGGWGSKTDTKGVVTWNADSLYLGYTGDQARYASVFTTKAIDLTGYSKLCVVVSGTSGTKEGAACVTKEASVNVSLETVLSKMAAYVRIPVDVADKATYEADISTLEGEHYIQLVAAVFKGTFHEVYLV